MKTIQRKAARARPPSRPGMWSTIGDAVSSGWGATVRMVVILLTLGVMGIGAAMAMEAGALRSLIGLLISR